MANRRQAEMSRAEQVGLAGRKAAKKRPGFPLGVVSRRRHPKCNCHAQEHQNSSGGHPQETYHHDSS